MPLVSHLVLALLLFLSGGYAGILLFCVLALSPALRGLSLQQYAATFRALDNPMTARMPAYKLSLLLLYLLTLILFWPQRHTAFYIAVAVCMGLSLGDLAINVSRQLPLNRKLQQLSSETGNDILLDLRERTIRYFRLRFALSATSFLLLCFAATLCLFTSGPY